MLQLDKAKNSNDRVAEQMQLGEVLSILDHLVVFTASQQEYIQDTKQQLGETNQVLADVTAWSQTQANALKEAQEAKEHLQKLMELRDDQLKEVTSLLATVRPEAEKWASERTGALQQLEHSKVQNTGLHGRITVFCAGALVCQYGALHFPCVCVSQQQFLIVNCIVY